MTAQPKHWTALVHLLPATAKAGRSSPGGGALKRSEGGYVRVCGLAPSAQVLRKRVVMGAKRLRTRVDSLEEVKSGPSSRCLANGKHSVSLSGLTWGTLNKYPLSE